ncbi:MAG TPA: CdaR family protein [Terriglobales bacterium]|jgi:diadenylate cyclase|nr:CdaR family protein [Terriglobales bacterium]
MSKLQHFLFHNFGLKLFSLALAVSLWLVVARNPHAEVAVDVPIEFHHIPENLEINSENIPMAQVRVRGPEHLVHRLRPYDVHVEVDLTDAKPGERTFDLTAQQVREPRDLSVVQVVPSQFHLSFDTRMMRQVEVRPRVIGNFASGLRIAKAIANPAVITIVGPRVRVEAVEAATTDPVDASGVMTSQTFSTNVYVSDPLVQIVHPAPVHVTVIMEKSSRASGAN